MTSSRNLQVTIGDGSDPPGRIWTEGLEEPEQDLVDRAKAGEVLNLPRGATPPEDDAPVDVKAMGGWGANRTIRAEMLRHLLVESEWPVHAKGVQLQGARITGKLDLESATLRCPLVLKNCYIQEPVVLECATSPRLGMSRCWLAGLKADLLIVTKELDLSGSIVTGTVQLLGAQITGQLVCRAMQIDGIDGRDGVGNSLIADEATVGGTLFLDHGFSAAGAVRLVRADIKGLLLCRDAHLKGRGTDGYTLNAEDVTVHGSAFLDTDFAAKAKGPAPKGNGLAAGGKGLAADDVGFRADGPLWLVGASFTGPLSLRGAHIKGADAEGQAVFADGITVGGIFLDKEFTADGALRLFGANIKGDLRCTGAHITGNKAGNALFAERAAVSRSVFLDGRFTALGAVRLVGASIKGDLKCTDAQIAVNKDDNSLEADGATVGGDVSLNDTFKAVGAVRFSGAQIGGRLDLGGATLEAPAAQISATPRTDPAPSEGTAAGAETTPRADGETPEYPVAFIAEGAKIGQELIWAPTTAVKGIVNLERTQLHRLDDDWGEEGDKARRNAYWPDEGNLHLSGFVYDGFGGDRQATWQERLDWIRGQHPTPATGKARSFDPQPYQQLARVYRQAGKDDDALGIAIQQRSDLRKYGSLSRRQKVVNLLMDLTISHGYRPRRAVRALVVVWLVAFAMFYAAQQQTDVMVPVTGNAIASKCTKAYPCFAPAGYAIDITIPIIQTGQADSWRPNGAAHLGWVYLRSTWVFTGLGWAFTSLAVAGYTGLIRRE